MRVLVWSEATKKHAKGVGLYEGIGKSLQKPIGMNPAAIAADGFHRTIK